MSVTRKQFYNGEFKHWNKKGDDFVLTFLKNNSGRAWKADEIAKAVKKGSSHIRHRLAVLVKKGLVDRRIPLYIFKINKKKK